MKRVRERRVFRKPEPFFVGRNIRSRKVRCIDAENINHGVIDLEEALKFADEAGLDLVQVSVPKDYKDPPIVKVVDYGKFKFDHQKRQKAAQKKQRENSVKIKEIKLRPSTDNNDLQIKARAAQTFVDEGHRVKVVIQLRGRELSHTELAQQQINKFYSLLIDASFISAPQMNGRQMHALIGREVRKVG